MTTDPPVPDAAVQIAATDAEGLCLNCGGLGWFAVGENEDMIEPECPCVERDRLRARIAELAAENARLRELRRHDLNAWRDDR